MAHAVPSQVCDLINALFPDVEREQAARGQAGHYSATRVSAVLDQLDRIPEELIRLAPDDSTFYWLPVLSSSAVSRFARSSTAAMRACPATAASNCNARTVKLRCRRGVPTFVAR
jgi:hypothetical protein